MAQHDYVIANGTGAAVRSDLNNGLAAIVSNNSGATEPATMYAYQWWADTTTGLLKQRNAANSAWITIGTLASANLGLLSLAGGTMTGALAVTAGTAALPGIAVSGDLNTGIYSPGADTLALVTAGTNRLHVTSAGLAGIGTTTPTDTNGYGTTLDIRGSGTGNGGVVYLGNSDATVRGQLAVYGDGRMDFGTTTNHPLKFYTFNNERGRFDSSGRFLVGTSTGRSNFFNTSVSSALQIEGTSSNLSRAASIINNSTSDDQAILVLGKSNGASVGSNTLVASGNTIGSISFQGNDGAEFVSCASIDALIDGTPGANDMPGRLVFSTTADGGSSPTERMRIDSAGLVKISGSTANSSVYALEVRNSATTDLLRVRNDGYFITGSAAQSPYNLTTGSAANVNIDGNGGLQRVTSSLKYKKDVEDTAHGLDELLLLRSVTYKGKGENDGDKVFGGLIAEEVDAAGLSEFVQYAQDGSPDSLAYGNMVSLCIKAIQEQQVMITELQAEVTALKAS